MTAGVAGNLRNGAVPVSRYGIAKLLMPHRGAGLRFLTSLVDTLTGMLLCVWLALTASVVGQTWPYPTMFLVLLVPVVGAVARVWGFASAVLGMTSALVVLRVGLLVPVGRLEVASADARTALFWVILGASVAAYVFARPQGIRTQVHGGGDSC